MENPVYQDLSWNTYPVQQCKQKDYRILEIKRTNILQSLQQSPTNRVELENQLHQIQTEMYMIQNSQKTSYPEPAAYTKSSQRPPYTTSTSETPTPMDSDLMDMLGLPQSGTWTKQFIDSGIASGSTTSPPSDDGGNHDYQNDIDDELAMHNIPAFDWEVPYSKSSYNGNQSRSQRLRAELFPDATEETTPAQYNHSPVTPTSAPSLQTLGESTNIATHSPNLENIIPYQDDGELAMQAIPEFCKLLNQKNPDILLAVTTCVHQLSKRESSMRAMLSHSQLITSLIHTVTTVTDTQIMRCCVGTLHNLSYLREGMDAIHKFRGIPILCDLLNNHNDTILYYTITTLHNLIQRHQISQEDICLSGGLEKMISLLKYTDKPQFIAMVADCIHLLCHHNTDKKAAIAACDGPAQLVKVLRVSTPEYLTWAVIRVLKTLSVCPRNKKAIINAGGMQLLARHLDTGSQRVTEEVLYTMRNLSNSITKLENLDALITKLMDVLSRTNINFIACSVGCLSNLTCNNPNNKKAIFRSGGMDTLLRCLLHHHTIPSVSEPLLCTLRHINYKHADNEQTQHAFRSTGGVSLLTKVLSTAQHWAVIKATCGLIRNLSLNNSNIPFFKETGLLIQLLQCSLRLIEHHKSGFNEIRDGIRLEDILNECMKTFQTVSVNSEVQAQLTSHLMVHLVLNIMNSSHEGLIASALAITTQLSGCESFMLMIKKDPRSEVIGKLGRMQRNQTISQLAAVLSARLGDVKTDMGPTKQQDHTPNVFTNEGWSNGENNNTVSSMDDVVDLDTTTAQYRDKTGYVKSPAHIPSPQFSPHYNPPQQRSPAVPTPTHLNSPHYMQNVPFPTTYPPTTYMGSIPPNYHHPNSYPTPYGAAYTPNQTMANRSWYTAM